MIDSNNGVSRRDALRMGLAAGLGLAVGGRLPLHAAELVRQQLPLITKAIPSSGERIPVVGIGTNAFRASTEEERMNLCNVLRTLSERGGKVVDTARQYGQSEEVIGQCVKEIGNRDQLFIATKYSMGGGRRGGGGGGEGAPDPRPGLEQAFTRLQMQTIDLMMVHNFGGTDALMPVMREMKQAGRFRYIGASTSSDSAYETAIAYLDQQPDFIEVDYSVGNRGAAERVLPAALDKGVAVLINVPFGGRRASVLSTLSPHPLPAWAAEIDCTSWAQVCLKYLVSHPAVTAVIPGTTKVEHAIDNNGAARGRLPDEAMRKRLEEFYDSVAG